VRSSIKPLSDFVFFAERNLGRYDVPEQMRAAGATVIVHADVLPDASPDEDWIELCGKKGWIAITEDKHIRYRAHEIEAVRHYKAKVFVLRAKQITGLQKGQIIAAALPKLARFAQANDPPFVASLVRSGRISPYSI
jgi:predicted nuclease of predicted toxin-antitoxin system